MRKFQWLLLAGLAWAGAAQADTLAKIAESRRVVLGVRDSSPPLSYSLGAGRYAGFHVALCERIVDGIRRERKMGDLKLAYQAVTSANRVPLVRNGTVDLECGTTTNNLARQKDVAFAVTTFVTEIRMAVKAGSGIQSVAQLGGKTVATTTGSTGVKALRQHQRAAGLDFQEVQGPDHGQTFLMLESGRADAMVIDDNILAGAIAASKNPADYRIVGETLSIEPIAIMLRRDDPAWKQAVDAQIAALMKSGEFARMYEQWFVQPIPPRQVPVGLPMSQSLRRLVERPNDQPAESYLQEKP